MKKRMKALLTALLLALALCVPAMAAVEYGAIYDETEELGSVELTYQGEQTLPQLTEALGIDLRVDVFTDEGVEDSSVSDIAVYVYENSGYGCGEKRDGVSLTLLLRGTEDGAYTLSETDWCVYTLLDAARGSAQELSDVVRDAVSPYMVQRAWNGEDMTMSATALSQAVNAMAEQYDMPVLYSCHPRSRKRLEQSGFEMDRRVIAHKPLGFHDYNCLQMNAFCVVSDSGTLPEESSFFTSVGHPFPAVCIRTSTERPEALDKGCFVLAGIEGGSLLQAVDVAVEMNRNGDLGIPVPDYTDENVSDKVVRLIQSYTSVVNKMVWRKQ